MSLIGRWLGDKPTSPRHLASEKRGTIHQSELLGLPEQVVAPVQNLDSESSSFGSFAYMLDYDLLP